MKKVRLPYHVIRRARGRRYDYYERGGKRIRLAEYGTPEFLPSYHAAAAEIKDARQTSTRTWRRLIDLYRASEKWRNLSPRTKADYDGVLNYMLDKAGDDDPRKMRRAHVEAAMFANRDRGAIRFANYLRQVLSILFNHAIYLEWMTHNPAKGIPAIKGDGGDMHKPWPPAALEAYAEKANSRARLVMELCLGTGQRIGDVLKMRWSDIEDGEIRVVQNKTGAELWIPLTGRLAAYLATVKKEGLYVVCDAHGRKLSYRATNLAVIAARRASGTADYTIHGWRYTAARELAEAGCSDDLIAAVTGHTSAQMVKKYAGAARQRARARIAQGKRK